jgi:hypothetical protein
VSGGKFIFSGTGGSDNGTYHVFTSTNLLTPLSSWTPIATNMFNANGTFSVTNGYTPGNRQQFYIIK